MTMLYCRLQNVYVSILESSLDDASELMREFNFCAFIAKT
jgi:hypothetical protein